LGEGWQELGFDSELATAEVQIEGTSPPQSANQTERRVVAWTREIEGGIELSFYPPSELV